MLPVEVVSGVNAGKFHGGTRERSNVTRGKIACGGSRVDEVRRSAFNTIAQAVKDLEAWRVLEVPANLSVPPATGTGNSTHSRSICKPRSKLVYAMLVL